MALSPEKDAISLCRTYKDYFSIGTAINPDVDLASADRMAFIAFQYNSVTPENQMKPRQIHPSEKIYNWAPADRIVDFAAQHRMKVRGHTLVWQQNVPTWMVMQDGKIADKEYLFNKMKAHIQTVMSRYKKDVYCWDVVNEAISDKQDEIFRAKDTLYAIGGEEYVEMAFRFARQADAKAKLYYNDYRFSDPVKRKKIYELLKRLKEKGTPIDGVGFQSHYVPDEISESYLQETIDMFASLGLSIQITELDVSVYNYREKSNGDRNTEDDAYTDERRKKQSDMYSMLFRVYRRNKDKVSGVTFWGSSDMRTNYRTRRIGKMDYPFLFDENMKAKPTLRDVVQF
jgi:endo-1,4-beta-xylanase